MINNINNENKSKSGLDLNTDSLMSVVSKLELDPKEFDGLELETDKVEWYVSRFEQCKADGVPLAINEYLKRLARDDVNAYTRVQILHLSMQYI